MNVLCHKQQLSFTNHGKWVESAGKAGTSKYVPGHYEDGNGEHVTVAPQAGIRKVPDWVRDTETFARAAKAGLIVEVGVMGPALDIVAEEVPVISASGAVVNEVSEAEAKKPETVTGLSGGGAAPAKKSK